MGGLMTTCRDALPLCLPLRIEQGETKIIPLHVVDADGLDVDITGYTFAAQIRRKPSSSIIAATFAYSITVPAGGLVQLSLTAVQTAAITCGDTDTEHASQYYWDVFATSPGAKVTKLAYGEVVMVAQVTR
jgi:hypothetical protein